MWKRRDVSETDSSSSPLPPRTRKFRPGSLKRLKPAAQVLLSIKVSIFKPAQDLISELPDDVLHLIIGKLTLLDSVRASILSHRWNPICLTRPDLVFDRSNMFLTPHSHESSDPYDCRQYQGKFVRAVDQVLRSYQGRKLRSFKINFCLGSNSTDDIDRWISFAIGMGAEELSLGF
ncbi:hypothetical protein Tsubulata_005028 [Turnera subulata]|uniref:F-box domain-containing protein n=1 Tax=Turnera subulata TaxID=218843 RepID=A0A9Q0FAW6_9ROSI|nr:hypothetical protein Tsubulata_005028 [Turnera subulata]